MGKVMRHTLSASLNIRHNLSSSKGPKPLQLKLLTTYIPKTSALTLSFSIPKQVSFKITTSQSLFDSICMRCQILLGDAHVHHTDVMTLSQVVVCCTRST